MNNHTPTPWNWHGPYMTGAYKVSAMDSEDRLALRLYIEPSAAAEADAKFIVTALEDALYALANAFQVGAVNGFVQPLAHTSYAAARATLAKREERAKDEGEA